MVSLVEDCLINCSIDYVGGINQAIYYVKPRYGVVARQKLVAL